MVAYNVTRATLVSYKADIKNMLFLRRFVASVLDGTCQDVKCNKAVRVPFLGHLTQELFEVFNNTKPTLMALLSLAKPPQ